jgi:hypothetical protein
MFVFTVIPPVPAKTATFVALLIKVNVAGSIDTVYVVVSKTTLETTLIPVPATTSVIAELPLDPPSPSYRRASA